MAIAVPKEEYTITVYKEGFLKYQVATDYNGSHQVLCRESFWFDDVELSLVGTPRCFLTKKGALKAMEKKIKELKRKSEIVLQKKYVK